MIIIHPTAKVSSQSDIEDSIRNTKIEIGENSVIDSFVKIKPAGGDGDVTIGKSTFINSGTVIYTGNGVKIGNHVSIAANCTFAATNHAYKDKNKLIQNQGFLPSKGGITLEDDVWVGAGSVFLDGAYVETGVVIAAGSVVKGRLKAYGVYSGENLERIRDRT
ncbi:MAG: DapH/DapD/GlmU-related protein [Nitratireductor sp.]